MVNDFTSDRIVTAKKGRVRGFAPWRPHKSTKNLMISVATILQEYRELNLLPLTIRQVFYRLVANYVYGKTELAYKRLSEHLNRARRSGMFSFDDFRDDGVTKTNAPGYQSQAQIQSTVNYVLAAGINKQVCQPVQQLVICEAAGMVPQLERIADDYGVEVWSSSGFDGVNLKHELAQYAASLGKPLVVHHFGDYDPSGVHVFQSFAEDVEAFSSRLGGEVTFKRVGITPDLIKQFNLPMAPTKTTDARAFDGSGTVQLEALDPVEIAKLLRVALGSFYDNAVAAKGERQNKMVKRDVITNLALKYGKAK